MTYSRKLGFGLALGFAILASAQRRPDMQQKVVTEQVGAGFESGTAAVNGTTLHYVRGGSGPAVILIHGFPEDWYEYRKIMPTLAKKFTVVAVDLRGIGGSLPTENGYETANLAEDIHQLMEKLKLQRAFVFGHDIGGMVAYALGREFPSTLRGAMIMDVAFPGLEPWKEIEGRPQFWHIRFHQTDLPEKLVAGRQPEYFRYFLRPPYFSNADVAHYASSHASPDQFRAVLEIYRAFPQDGKFYASHSEMISLPIVFGAGSKDAFAEFVPKTAEALRAHGCVNLRTQMIEGSSHYVAEEAPSELGALIERFASE